MDAIDFAPVVLVLVGGVFASAMYVQGQTRGFARGRAIHEPLIAALKSQVKSYGDLIGALNEQIAAQKNQLEAQERLLTTLRGK